MAAPAPPPQGDAKFSYVPAPFEQAYYLGLFDAADAQKQGSIGGAQAVQFFSRSKLPVETLKGIWTLSDMPPTNSLDHRKFAVAIRLIQLAQNRQAPVPPNLAVPDGVTLRPVFFEGVSGVSVPLPPPEPAPGGAPPSRGATPTPHQQQAPPSPQRSVASPQRLPTHPPSNLPPAQQALTAQDPYTLTPSEQSRYEQIFPEYAKPDGFVYGAEAVALFGKSGMPQQQLAAIWNMVDQPVDNRLDKLEFAMAMHLIVCVSKKNLPMPPALPMSLKQLKSQQPPGSPLMSGIPSPGGAGIPSPGGAMQQPSGSGLSVGSGPPPIQRVPTTDSAYGYGGPQPVAGMHPQAVAAAGGGSVGLSGLPGPPPLQQGGMNISDAFEGLGPAGDTGSISSFRAATPTMPPAVTTASAPSSPQQHQVFATAASSGLSTGSSIPEPAPSIPTPATMMQASSPAVVAAPPKTTQELASSYNLGEASEELEKLRAALQKLQAENISLKAKLGTMSDEEKDVQKELSATVAEISKLSTELTNTRAQVLAAKSRLLEAAAELTAAKEKKGVITDLIAEANATKEAIDEAYDGIEKANEVAHAPPPAAPTMDGDLFSWDEPAGPVKDSSPPLPGDSGPLPGDSAPAQLSRDSAVNQQYSVPALTDKARSVQQNEPPPPAPAAEENHQPTFVYQPPAPAPASDSYGHKRDPSLGFGEVMGGSAPDLKGMASEETGGAASHDAYGDAPSIQNVEELKKKAKEAHDVAKDAEDSRQQLVAQLNELRRVADQAEQAARDAANKSAGKKKGPLWRGQKRDAKEAEKLSREAKEKKDAFLQVQAQLKDAEACASDTRREADRLHREAEDAEMRAASAASMQSHNPSNGYGASSNPSAARYSQPPPAQPTSGSEGGFGSMKPPSAGGFNSNVMAAGGGLSIPMPAGQEDPYSNPFE